MKNKNLPKKLSDLLDIAIDDLIAVERQKKTYVVNMAVYHRAPGPDNLSSNRCEVCFAGAVMAKTLECDPTKTLNTQDFGSHNEVRLDALDKLRVGYIDDAFESIGSVRPFGLADRVDVVAYSYDPTIFKKQMRQLAHVLRGFNA